MDDRRQYPRLTTPLEGTWRGRSGASACRIADISWGGCFIQTLAEPGVGEGTEVAVPVGDGFVYVSGTVVYVERAMGFSVQFDPLTEEQIAGLTPLLGEPPASVRATR